MAAKSQTKLRLFAFPSPFLAYRVERWTQSRFDRWHQLKAHPLAVSAVGMENAICTIGQYHIIDKDLTNWS